MQYVANVVSAVNKFYQELNPATLSGAIDVIVVKGSDGELSCSPFHVRFGKLRLVRPADKLVEFAVNNEVVNFPMKVGEAGEAFFVLETEKPVPRDLQTSPLTAAIDTGQIQIDHLDLNEENEEVLNHLIESDLTTKFQHKDDEKIESSNLTKSEIHFNAMSKGIQPTEDILFSKEYGNPENIKKIINSRKSEYPTSDTEVDRVAEKEIKNLPNDSSNWSWNWGNLPVKKQTEEEFDTATAVEERNFFSTCVTPLEEKIPKVEMSLCRHAATLDPLSNILTVPEDVFEEHSVDFSTFCENPTALFSNPQLLFKIGENFYDSIQAFAIITSYVVFHRPLSVSSFGELIQSEKEKKLNNLDEFSKSTQNISGSVPPTKRYSFTGFKQWFSRSSMEYDNRKDLPEMLLAQEKDEFRVEAFQMKNYAKTLRLNSDQLKRLPLRKGVNTVTFTVSSSLGGKATCSAKLFFWDHDEKVVISDVDGTITKSDVFGHLFTMVGKDWTHSGVASLYTNIAKNGYHILYLTSRAIGQADMTRGYLKKVEQGQYQLPDGPVIMSPDRLFTSFHREVIMRKPEEFKIAALKDILRLFKGENPFYAGFGNRITDALSYRSVGVPLSKIFTVDPKGDVKRELLHGYKSSYPNLNSIVDQIFPSLTITGQIPFDTDYNDWNYWKTQLPQVEIDIEESNDEDISRLSESGSLAEPIESGSEFTIDQMEDKSRKEHKEPSPLGGRVSEDGDNEANFSTASATPMQSSSNLAELIKLDV